MKAFSVLHLFLIQLLVLSSGSVQGDSSKAGSLFLRGERRSLAFSKLYDLTGVNQVEEPESNSYEARSRSTIGPTGETSSARAIQPAEEAPSTSATQPLVESHSKNATQPLGEKAPISKTPIKLAQDISPTTATKPSKMRSKLSRKIKKKDPKKCLGFIRPWDPFEDEVDPLNSRSLQNYNSTFGRRKLLRSKKAGEVKEPLKRRCSAESKINDKILDEEKDLAECLHSSERLCRGDAQEIMSSVLSLHSIKSLMKKKKKVKCLTVHNGGCSSLSGNPETIIQKKPKEMFLGNRDIQRRYKTCAIVGNGPGLKKNKKGKIIDLHEAVFRFNAVQNNKDQGKKTTFRIINSKRAYSMAVGAYKVKATPNELWLLWNYSRINVLPELRKVHRNIRVLSPQLISFSLNTYFKLRRDLKRLGNHMKCPRNMNSGIHGIMMALQMCEQINVFGFSYSKLMLKSHEENSLSPRMSKYHDWTTDALLVRLLGIGGVVHLC